MHEFGSDGGELISLSFEWAEESGSAETFTKVTGEYDYPYWYNSTTKSGDFNGDGRTDLISHHNSTSKHLITNVLLDMHTSSGLCLYCAAKTGGNWRIWGLKLI